MKSDNRRLFGFLSTILKYEFSQNLTSVGGGGGGGNGGGVVEIRMS